MDHRKHWANYIAMQYIMLCNVRCSAVIFVMRVTGELCLSAVIRAAEAN
jgi:hypothetical protein